MKKNFVKQTGFTLIELLAVVIIIGVLSAIIIPRLIVSKEDAKISMVKSNLKILRKAVDLYRLEHNDTYPGATKSKDGEDETDPGKASDSFVKQLTLYTDVMGKAEDGINEDKNIIYGPYIRFGKLPTNPFNSRNDVKCDVATTDITVRDSDGSTGWKFYTRTGNLLANDGNHDDL